MVTEEDDSAFGYDNCKVPDLLVGVGSVENGGYGSCGVFASNYGGNFKEGEMIERARVCEGRGTGRAQGWNIGDR